MTVNNQFNAPTTLPIYNDVIIEKIITFVYDGLETWQKEYKKNPSKREDNENKLSEELCLFLEVTSRKSECNFMFHHQKSQDNRRSVDMSTHYVKYPSDPITVFECKRLPAPEKRREKEYITGGEKVSGGIQRFKLEEHGKDFTVAGMIGYIQNKDALHFHNQINTWINDLTNQTDDGLEWSADECLQYKRKKEKTYHSISKHNRQSKPPIILHHLWIDMH